MSLTAMNRSLSGSLLVLVLVSVGCGEGSSSPGGPTSPSPPVAPADIVAAGSLTIGVCTPPGCAYSLPYRNDGPGCGNNVRGKIRLYEQDLQLQSIDWWLDVTRVVGPGETFTVEDCCLDPETVRRRDRITTESFWNNVSCR